ncbi:MAG: 30S ribosomal protein S19e [Thermoplasmata archaeon]
MVTVYDVPPERLIDEVSNKLKEKNEIVEPDWAPFVKTGMHKEKAPLQAHWWYTRVSAVFRSVYLEGPVGISKLRGKYGGAQDNGSKPYHAVKGSGSIVRTALKQLEDAGLVVKEDNKGRAVTPEGRSLLDNTAYEVMKDMAKEDPELSKYL